MERGKEEKRGRENKRRGFIKPSPPVRSSSMKTLKMLC